MQNVPAANPHRKTIQLTQNNNPGSHVPLINFVTARYLSKAITTKVMLFANIAVVVINGIIAHIISPRYLKRYPLMFKT